MTLPSVYSVRAISPNRGLSRKSNHNRMANNVDSDGAAHYEPSHQNLNCLRKRLFGLQG